MNFTNNYRSCFMLAKTRKRENSGQIENVGEILINGKDVMFYPNTTTL